MVPNILINEINRFSQDGNAIDSINGQFTKLVLCADESDVYRKYFKNFDIDTYDVMLIRNNNDTTSFSGNTRFSWVNVDDVIAYSLGLKKDEL